VQRTKEQIHEARRRLKQEYGQLFDSVSALLFRHDPIGINFEENTDEYDLEAETILPRLRKCTSELDVLRAVHEEFVRWFEVETAGPLEKYAEIAKDIWDLWQTYLKQKSHESS
jgi:hypothetical protein